MLPKQQRGLSAERIEELFTSGESVRGKFFLIKSQPVPSRTGIKFGVGVSKKLFTNKAKRNRLQRLVWQALNTCLINNSLIGTLSRDCFVLLSRQPENSAELVDDLEALLKKFITEK